VTSRSQWPIPHWSVQRRRKTPLPPLPSRGTQEATSSLFRRACLWSQLPTRALFAQVRRLLNAIKANSIANRKPEKHEINNLRRAAHALAEIAKQGTYCLALYQVTVVCDYTWLPPWMSNGVAKLLYSRKKKVTLTWHTNPPCMTVFRLRRGERRHGRERGRRRPGRRAADALHAAPGAEDGRQHLAAPAQVRSVVRHVVVDSRIRSTPGLFWIHGIALCQCPRAESASTVFARSRVSTFPAGADAQNLQRGHKRA